MSSNFTYDEISLKDAVEFIVDNRGKTVPTEENGIPLIATSCINNNDLYPIKEKLRYVSQETYDNWFRSHPKPNDIIITNKGSQNGAVCLVPDPVDFCIAQDMVALRADKNKIDPTYLFAALRSSLVQNRIKSLNVDAVIPHFKKTDFNKLFIPLPSRKTQELIGKTYLDFCRKIELNNRINQTLELTARAIFKSWFVDFDPVKAKIEAIEKGEDPELAAIKTITGKTNNELDFLSTNNLNKLKNIASQFSNSFIHSEQGEIPKGWSIQPFTVLAKLDTSSVKPFAEPDTLWEHYSIPSFDSSGSPSLDFGHQIKSNKYKVNPTSILVSKLNPTTPRVWLPNVKNSDVAICSTEFMQFIPINHLFRPFIFNLIASQFFQSEIQQRVTGSTGSRQRAQPKSVAKIEIIVSPVEVIQEFCNIVSATQQLQAIHQTETEKLKKIRDTLLPKLLSGELTLPKAEAQIEKATA